MIFDLNQNQKTLKKVICLELMCNHYTVQHYAEYGIKPKKKYLANTIMFLINVNETQLDVFIFYIDIIY